MRISDDDFQFVWESATKKLANNLYPGASVERGKFLLESAMLYREVTNLVALRTQRVNLPPRRTPGPHGSPA